MRKNIKTLLLAGIMGSVALVSCNKYLDINENPNNPEKSDPSLLLPTVEAALSQVVGNQFQTYGNMWSQYWTQNPSSSQYQTIDQYNMRGTNSDRAWLNLYRGALNNAEIIINTQGPTHAQYRATAYILKAYAFQLATDAFGDVPLSEALKAGDNLNPAYEKQQVVYDSIFHYIDKGVSELKSLNTSIANNPGEQDMLFKGDAQQWIAFANTLKLRAYLRISNVDPAKAEAGIKALYATNPSFVSKDVSIAYTTTGGNENPMYNEMVALGRVQNVVASGTIINAFKANNDPRQFALFEKIEGQDTIAWIAQGGYRGMNRKLVSPPAAVVGANANIPSSALAPVKLISKAESYFLQAEAALKGWGAGTVQALYESGVRAGFEALGLSSEATAYLTSAPDAQLGTGEEAQLKAIITQKYYSMCGFQGFEAWNEWRRTGYPTFFTVSKESIIGAGLFPIRMVYPNSEATTNVKYPGTIGVSNPVWWDVK